LPPGKALTEGPTRPVRLPGYRTGALCGAAAAPRMRRTLIGIRAHPKVAR